MRIGQRTNAIVALEEEIQKKTNILHLSPTVSKKKNLNTNHIAVGDNFLFAGLDGLEAGVYVSLTGEVLKIVTWRMS